MRDHIASGGIPDRYYRPLLYAVTGGIVLAGVYFRFKGLGKSPFAIDEYYIATSVKSILEHGLPRFECGGFYIRGILLQYLVSPLFLSGMAHEYAFRLVTVLFNLAALPAVYLIARHLAGVVAACVAVILFSLSLWEVEFARFARMYAPFGTLFLWHLYFLYRNVILDDPRAAKWMFLLAFVSIFVSEFAVFLVLLNFLPLVLRPARQPAIEYTVPPVLLVLTYHFEMTNFRRLGAENYLPAEMMAESSSGATLPINIPPLLLTDASGSLPWLLSFLVPLLLFILAASLWGKWAIQPGGDHRKRLLALLPIGLMGMGLMNLYGLVVYSITILFLLSGLPRNGMPQLLRWPLVRLTAFSLAVSLVYWSAFVASTSSWSALLDNATGSRLKDAVLVLFGYPNVHWQVIVQWLNAMPLQTLLMAGLVAAGVWWASEKRTSDERGYLMLTAIVAAICVMVAALAQPYSTTRYTFFLYPVVLILSAVSMVRLGDMVSRRAWVRGTAALGLAAALMLMSEDFDVRHLWEIDSDRVTYRIGYSSGKQDQYYPRWDFHGAADRVNAGWQDGDTVISTEYGTPYYLTRMDYLYIDENNIRFRGISGCGGTRDIWEGAHLLRTVDDLFRQIGESKGAVWLIVRSEEYSYQTEGERVISALLGRFRVYQTVDGNLDVYRISPEEASVLSDLPDENTGRRLQGVRGPQ